MNNIDLPTITRVILDKIPSSIIPTQADGRIIQRHKAFFTKHENALVKGFYDVIFNDLHIKGYLPAEQRKNREQTLHQWYQVTMGGHFDDAYWNWQTFVGIVHVKHNVPNSAMLGMWGWMMNFIQHALFGELPPAEAQAVMEVLHKLQVVVSSLIVESFILSQREAIKRASGLNEAIMGRFVKIEIDRMLTQGRIDLQAPMLAQARAA